MDANPWNKSIFLLVWLTPVILGPLSKTKVEKDIFDFEPKLALRGGQDGCSRISDVISKTSYLIKKNGLFVLEIGYNQKYKVINMLKRKGFYIKKVLKDYSKNDRCIISTKI